MKLSRTAFGYESDLRAALGATAKSGSPGHPTGAQPSRCWPVPGSWLCVMIRPSHAQSAASANTAHVIRATRSGLADRTRDFDYPAWPPPPRATRRLAGLMRPSHRRTPGRRPSLWAHPYNLQTDQTERSSLPTRSNSIQDTVQRG
jgi:hypothetical protein